LFLVNFMTLLSVLSKMFLFLAFLSLSRPILFSVFYIMFHVHICLHAD